jgi:hypothetical protein
MGTEKGKKGEEREIKRFLKKGREGTHLNPPISSTYEYS